MNATTVSFDTAMHRCKWKQSAMSRCNGNAGRKSTVSIQMIYDGRSCSDGQTQRRLKLSIVSHRYECMGAQCKAADCQQDAGERLTSASGRRTPQSRDVADAKSERATSSTAVRMQQEMQTIDGRKSECEEFEERGRSNQRYGLIKWGLSILHREVAMEGRYDHRPTDRQRTAPHRRSKHPLRCRK